MNKTIVQRFLMVVGLTVLTTVFSLPPSVFGENAFSNKLKEFKITLGLDLAGGTELDYKIDLSDAIAQNNDSDPQNNVKLDDIAESVRDALEKRVNPAGIGEIIVKRSQVDAAEHVLIQMPPSSSVEQAKKDAEKDNRLEFYEEDPSLIDAEKNRVQNILGSLNAGNWDTRVAELEKDPKIVFQKFDLRWLDEIHDPALSESLQAANKGTVLSEVADTQTEMEYTLDENGQLTVQKMPVSVLGILRVTDRITEEREKVTPEQVEARHILFAYPGAERAGEGVKYQSEEEARLKAEKILEQLKSEGTVNFAELAKEYSTEPAAQASGGSLGKFSRGQMTPVFEDAAFGNEIGLVLEIITSPFGFHIMEVQAKFPETKETVKDTKIAYELLGWKKDDLGWKRTALGGAQLENATVGIDEIGQPKVDLLFNDEGGKLFGEITERVANRKCDNGACRLGIKVGGNWISLPTVHQKIIGRSSQITGNFTFDSAKELTDGLNLGAIDAPVRLSGQMTIEPTLGQDQLNKSLKASALGLFATMVFMIISYRLAGLVAAFGLILYAGIYVLILKFWPDSFGGPIVLSLSGLAGIALSLGLAVDGNILIFERMKEEIQKGRGLHQALDVGFERAWNAIRDSNFTTLITCLILYNLGSAMIKGFAITLIVGTLLSMFTAITISRNVLHFILLSKGLQKPWLFGLSKEENSK
jgi:preprotein translocase subunit SecD